LISALFLIHSCRRRFYALKEVLPFAWFRSEDIVDCVCCQSSRVSAKSQDFTFHDRGRVRFRLLALVAAVALFPLLIPAQELSPTPGARIVQLTPEAGYFTEPSIAVNPQKPLQMVAAYQDNAHVAASSDGGATWVTPAGIAPPNYRVSGDVSVTYDSRGHAILCYMAFDKLGTFNYWAHNASRSGLFVRRSLDGGAAWEADPIAVIQHETSPGMPWEDKPYIVADNSAGPHAGNLYVGWTRWTLADSEILIARSTDGGATWSAPLEISTHRGLPRDDNGAAEGFSGAVGPDGSLYVVWALDNQIVFRTSSDGGQSFSPEQNIIPTAPIMFQVQAVERSNGFPVIAVDPGTKNRPQRLFVAWSDYRNGDVDVFCSTSTDRGRTWSDAVRVNSDPLHDGADQFFHWLAVDPTDGSANLVYYDRRRDPANRNASIVLARSTDGGKSFSNYAWTSEGFNPGGIFMGDYTGIAALGGMVYGVWTEKPPGTAPLGRHPGTVIKVGIAGFK
jgi:hypothetical protein